ncbi:MAG: VOC family protein [Thermoplasmata archaeon]|nr:VOC family protein [Thermoplasmata archaeon]NIS13289.1 VOC family protein [Thermoplasmata archaeon]NIS21187.1 VOC family protein [Thermoplasmata archaeon]NIT78681.1 VOC family protein [Thermoplasmata archaeon]NIU50245.1 VOC family protein [Thermoplasmata archaeon]
MDIDKNMIGWVDIPVKDMDRAVRFYEQVFDVEMTREPVGSLGEMAMFPSVQEGVGASGALVVHGERYRPSTEGVLMYFTPPSGDLANELGRVEAAGGKVLQEKTLLTEGIGYIGMFLDTEGNRLALHSRQ